MTPDDSDEPGVRDLARALDANPGSVLRWLRRGMPRDVAAARSWREQHARQRVKPAAVAASEPQGGSFSTWRARRERAAALQAELDLRVQAGELVAVADVRKAVGAKSAAFREALLQLADRLAPVVAAETDQDKCWRLLHFEVIRALQLLTGRDGRHGEADD